MCKLYRTSLYDSKQIESVETMRVIASLLLLATCSVYGLEPRVVELPLGKMKGSVRKTVYDREFYSFEGIPYAKPPTGENRFKEPQSPDPWLGTLIGSERPKCLQYNQVIPPVEDNIIGDEDCLYLNVYTPDTSPSKLYDVIVYIHGGGYSFTYCEKGPELLLDRDVIVVTFEYRVGPLGFLSTEDDIVPGNNGLKDQIAALKWVHNYIKYFGGNPDSVTITGVSAGGASVQFHYLFEESRGLFHKGFSQSGTTLVPWILSEKAAEKAKKLATIVGCETTTSKLMIDCMKQRPGRQIVQAMGEFMVWLYQPFTPFGAVVDTWASKPLLPDHPYKLLKNKRVADLPWISSYTKTEGLFPASGFYYDDYLADIDTRWNELMPFILDYNFTVDMKLHNMVGDKIRKFYMGNDRVSKATFSKLLQAIGDRIFVVDIEKGTRLHAAAKSTPTFAYVFNYRGAHSVSEINSHSSDDFGVSHADDTSYIMRTGIDTLSTENDKRMSKLLLDLIVSFAKTGIPDVSMDWPPLSKELSEPYTYLSIESPDSLKIERKNILGNRDFWDTLPLLENEKLFNNFKEEL